MRPSETTKMGSYEQNAERTTGSDVERQRGGGTPPTRAAAPSLGVSQLRVDAGRFF